MPNKVDRDLKHARAVRDIAVARFDFPSSEFPNLRTHVNEPEPALGVPTLDGGVLYPDIVVVEYGRTVVKMVAEVETADTVTDEEALKDWLPCSQLSETFYLYVPSGYGDQAKKICKRLSIKPTGIRTWRNLVGAETVDITDI